MKTSRTETLVTHAIVYLAAVIAVYPLLTILFNGFAGGGEDGGGGFGNFATAWERGNIGSSLLSSAFISISVVLVTLVVSTLAAYALATMRVPFAPVVLGAMLIGIVLPYEVTVLPLYELMTSWGLIDTPLALILPQIGLSVPLGVFWMRSFFASVPTELREAAEIDGAGRFMILRAVMLPIGIPALATLATILFLFTWNEFLLALVLIPQNEAVQTAPLALSFFSGAGRNSDPNVTAAAAVLVALPVLLAYLVLQRRLISGLTEGAVK